MRRGRKTGAEQVVLTLRQIEAQTSQGKSLAPAGGCWHPEARRPTLVAPRIAAESPAYRFDVVLCDSAETVFCDL